ncbi:hypothetical protein F53441_4114 [Fusarium austroafricanum]|uniref:Zn(2)-C6 fungal-type domain-containing protein n=1 Tax=Fusarium austroafricanum TaxID=2364996 RepID=A0A8H4KKX3_9HYPO|nr:hypothetical protein F53441_4114 [Fusarium austroafricanum]
MEQPPPTRILTRSSLACLPCRSKHVKCDAKKPRCSRCAASEKECQYTASRRGGVDRAALSEKRRRLATKTSTRPDETVPHSTCPDLIRPIAQPEISAVSLSSSLDGGLLSETPTLVDTETPQLQYGNLAEDALVISYYTNFHNFHPFAPPFQHLVRLSQHSSFNFDTLISVMRLIGHLYNAHRWSDSLSNNANALISQLSPSDPMVVQSRLLYSIALFWHNFRPEAKEQIDTAVDIAVKLGMNKQDFAAANGAGDAVMIESWRRTWWMTWIVDGYYAGTLGTMNIRTLHVESTVDLPCEEADYELGMIPEPHTIDDLDSREFTDEETVFSSFAYLIGALRCSALAISVTPKKVIREDSESVIRSADSVIDAWLLLLPKDQKPILKKDGTIDELMFQAHLLIHVATIGLHRPLSDLRFNPIESVSSCAREPPPDTPKPELINVHTVRILKSVNAQIQLLALPVRPFHHSPFTTCMVSERTLALLSACNYLLQGNALAIARDQIRLTIGCLKSVGEVWPRTAKNVKEIQTIARHVLGLKGKTGSSATPRSSQVPSLTGSEEDTSLSSIGMLDQGEDVLASLGSLDDICGWMNMDVNVDSWMGGTIS